MKSQDLSTQNLKSCLNMTNSSIEKLMIREFFINNKAYTGIGGSRRKKGEDRAERIIPILKKHKIFVNQGNDAPRGGIGGNYIKLMSPKMLSNSRKMEKKRKAIEIEKYNQFKVKLESNEPFEVKIKEDGEILIYDFARINFEEIATAFNKRSEIKVTTEMVQYIYDGWKRDFKTYHQIKGEFHLYAACGCNQLAISLFKMQGEPLTKWV